MRSKPEVVTLDPGHSHVLSHSPVSDKMFLAHEELPRTAASQNPALAILAQASLRGCANVLAYAQGKMSRSDVMVALACDLRDGVVVWAVCQGTLTALVQVEQHAAGTALGHLCSVGLHNPAVVMFGTLGVGRIAAQYLQYRIGQLTAEQFHEEVMQTTTRHTAAIITCMVGDALQASMVSRTLLNCVSCHAAAMWASYVWRERRTLYAEAKLRSIALEVMGLEPNFTSEQLGCRWRSLARYAHPDRNTQPDAKQTFAIFSLCRDILQEADVGLQCKPSGRFVGLLRRLRRARWAARTDLPFAGALVRRSAPAHHR